MLSDPQKAQNLNIDFFSALNPVSKLDLWFWYPLIFIQTKFGRDHDHEWYKQMKSSQNIGHTKFTSCSSDFVLKTLERASDLKMSISFPFFLFVCHFWWAKRKILCRKYISYIFHVFSEARDHILILNILFFNKLRQIIPEIRSKMRDLLIFIFILKMTGTFTPGRIYKCHFTSGRRDSWILEYMCHNLWQ